METTEKHTPSSKGINHGKNVEHYRRLRRWTQEGLASQVGKGWTQRKVSKYEEMEIIDDESLEELAAGLGLSPEFLKNYEGETNVVVTQTNTFHKESIGFAHNAVINPLDKIVELYAQLIEMEKEKSRMYKEQLELLQQKMK